MLHFANWVMNKTADMLGTTTAKFEQWRREYRKWYAR